MDAMAYLQPVAQIAPETLKNFDFHAIVRDTQPIFNYSSTYLVPEEKRDEELAAQQAEAQKQKQMMEAQQTAELAKTGKEVLPNAQQE